MDASSQVYQVLRTYAQAISHVADEVAGEPAAIWQAEARYRGGAARLNQVSSDVSVVSARLSTTWSGPASDAYQGSSRSLAGRLDHSRQTLIRQADGLAQVAQAQARAQSGVAQTAQQFAAAADQLLAASRAAAPAAANALVAEAHDLGAACYNTALRDRDGYAKELSAVAAMLRQSTTAQPVPAMTDYETMYKWLYGCIVERELGKGGPRESAAKTTAGISASMASTNQTIMINAVDTLLSDKTGVLATAQSNLTRDELLKAKARMAVIAKAHAAAHAARTADAQRTKVSRQLDALREQLKIAERDNKPTAGTQKSIDRQQADLQKLDSAIARANDLQANPAKLVKEYPQATTGLDDADLKNMLLGGVRVRQYNLRAEALRLRQQMKKTGNPDLEVQAAALERQALPLDQPAAALEKQLRDAGRPITVNADSVKTLGVLGGEDKAAWQRKGVNALDLGNGSIGERINKVAVYGDHRLLADAYLRPIVAAARTRNPADEEKVVVQVAKANNAGNPFSQSKRAIAYAEEVRKCYLGKKNPPPAAPKPVKPR
ncbi:hypothetical protein AB0M47_01495 [Hamadaea sp. NPDC051192]|uniref:hypothetical protein n=1 Tax=Hamadaea sp. NPDC051192 TaxID=3154940 RepID=UPI0034338E2E